MSAPLLPLRTERSTTQRTATTSRSTADPGADVPPEQQAQLAAQHQAFDFEVAEQAEMQREHEALQALIVEFLKNEDEIMKKWIALA